MKCQVCEREGIEYELKKCPICHKNFCQDCAVVRGGMSFCTRTCMEFFFYGESEEEEE